MKAGCVVPGLLFVALGCGREAGGADASFDPTKDRRIAPLLAGCVKDERYDREPSEIVPILVDKLATGDSEALQCAQVELGDLGEAAFPELARFFQRHYSAAFDAPLLENALVVAASNPAPGARALCLSGLDHPLESVRAAALSALSARHARPSDFDEFVARLDGPETASMRSRLARATFDADRGRAVRFWLERMDEGEDPQLWGDVAPLLVPLDSSARPLAARLLGRLPWGIQAWVAAAVAAPGTASEDPGAPAAAASLTALLRHADRERRLVAARAVASAGLADLLGPSVQDASPEVRTTALAAIGAGDAPPSDPAEAERRRAWLIGALDDPVPSVRELALSRLVSWGDPTAIDRALAEVDRSPDRLLGSLRAVRPAAEADAALAERFFERLLARDQRESHLPPHERIPTLKALGLVPLPAAAQHLHTLASEWPGESVQGLRLHDWLLIQAANTGTEGRAYLRRVLSSERDPLHRLDLMEAVASAHDELARETLFSFVRGEGRSPFEVLFAASRLVRLGPAERAMAAIQEAVEGVEGQGMRKALWCLLWRFY